MGQLFRTIQQLVAEEKYVVGEHASERLEERGIMEWQAVAALADGELMAEKPRSNRIQALKSARACRTAQSSRQFGPTCDRAASPSW